MQKQQRSSIVISALITTLVMVLTAGGLLAYNGLLALPGVAAQGSTSQIQASEAPVEAPIAVTVQPLLQPAQEQTAGNEASLPQVAAAPEADADALAAYQSRLDEAYLALEEAYAQIERLQSAQTQAGSMAYAEEYEEDEYEEDEYNEEEYEEEEYEEDEYEHEEHEEDEDHEKEYGSAGSEGAQAYNRSVGPASTVTAERAAMSDEREEEMGEAEAEEVEEEDDEEEDEDDDADEDDEGEDDE